MESFLMIIFRLLLILLAGMFCAMPPAMAAPVMVTDLRCESLENPAGMDVEQPRLSWIVQSAERGAGQTAYQVLAASSRALLDQDTGDRWNSGKVLSDQSIQVVYAGRELASFMPCYWKVRVWDEKGEASAWSDVAWWTMGVLEPADWQDAQWIGLGGKDTEYFLKDAFVKAQWIWADEEVHGTSAAPGKVFFRKAFDWQGPVSKAMLVLTADNEAECYLNGERLGRCHNYNSAHEFDLAPYLRAGRNLIAVSVENAGDVPNPAGLLALIHVADREENTLTIQTDSAWKATRQAVPGWIRPDFDDSAWTPAKVLGGYGMEPWNATELPDDRVLPARMLRREFDVTGPVRRASVYFSGLGLSELYVNGKKAGDAVLSPGCTEYDERVFYVSHDLTDRIVPGRNALGLWLGNGRYYAPCSRSIIAPKAESHPKALLLLRLEMADGRVETLVSDTAWKGTAEGPIRANNEFDGETYDARMEMPGWASPGFDDAGWQAVREEAAPGGVLAWEDIHPIRVMEVLKPETLSQPLPGVYIYDMGQNMVGWCRLRVRGPRGTQVKLRFAETLKPDGTLYMANLRGAKVTDRYTLKGEGDELYEPRFTYHGFRYVELTGFPGEPGLGAIEGCVVHDALPRAGSFTCSNALLNRIYSNIYWGTRGNYRSMPTDCPQRDERQGWLGDRSEESRGETYLFDLAALYSKWVRDMEDAQREDGSISDVSPAYWQLYNDNVTWPSSFIIIPDMLHDQYAGIRTIEAHYDGMKKWINHMRQYEENGIMPRDNYGDWCVPPESQELIHSKDPARKTPGEFLGTAYFCHDLNLMTEYAGLLGREADAAEFKAMADKMTAAFNRTFFDAEKMRYANGTQTSYVIPLAFGLAPEGTEKKLFAELTRKIETETDGHIGTGLIGGQQLMRVLSNYGRPDLAYTIATQTDYPSWGYMIEHGATTIWELWNGNTADPAMNSHNHVMLVGDLNLWFHEYLAGIRPAAPGFKSLHLKPYPVGDLTQVSASHRTLHGTVFSTWEIAEGTFNWRINVPPNTTARIFVPADSAGAVTESGVPAADAEGLRFTGMEETWAVFGALPGHYSFVSNAFTRPGE
jgi:alpha-L-rhamnosidase